MLGVLRWLTGSGIAAIGKELRQARLDKLNAENNEQRIAADIRVEQLEAQQAVLVAEQGRALTSWIRPAIAAPFVLYLWKIIVYDKILKWGVTDPLSDNMTYLMGVVIGAYFLTRPFEKAWKK